VKINRDIWINNSFSYKESAPPWPCPICNIGIIKGDKYTLKIEQSQATLKARRSLSYNKGNEAAEFRFAGFMVCENNHCREKIAVAGKGKLYATSTDGPVDIKYKGDRYSVYIPLHFEPALNLFIIPESCPQNIVCQIKKSFSHYFNDSNACANSIRTSLELIMNEQGIPNTNGKGKFVSLAQRIEKFNSKNSELKPLIKAVKWIGNAGSHIEEVDKSDLLDGYELLNFVIEELYERGNLFLKMGQKADRINSTKKPLSK
jgi:hypothetical protein